MKLEIDFQVMVCSWQSLMRIVIELYSGGYDGLLLVEV
jgi:hypothetical protein